MYTTFKMVKVYASDFCPRSIGIWKIIFTCVIKYETNLLGALDFLHSDKLSKWWWNRTFVK